ncbi:MAG: molybdenum cofactor biosynthesis protein MoaE [Pseudomonadales bacterium]
MDSAHLVRICAEDFSIDEENHRLRGDVGSAGALVNFTGHVRESKEAGQNLVAMELEHYPGMTENSIHDVIQRAALRWPFQAATVIHRIGRLQLGEQIVFVGVASPHRQEAFDACAFIMDFLKTEAPFWKKEHFQAGACRWVDARQSDTIALAKWGVETGP